MYTTCMYIALANVQCITIIHVHVHLLTCIYYIGTRRVSDDVREEERGSGKCMYTHM